VLRPGVRLARGVRDDRGHGRAPALMAQPAGTYYVVLETTDRAPLATRVSVRAL